MHLTEQQAAFIAAGKDFERSITLIAVAGAGKTTTAVALTKELNTTNRKVLACAFNKRNAEDLAKKMPSAVLCKTMNALGHGAWSRQLSKRQITLDTKKFYKLKEAVLPKEHHYDLADLPRIVDGFRNAGAIPPKAMGGLPARNCSVEDLLAIVERYDLDLEDFRPEVVYDWVEEILRRGIAEGWRGLIDFTDQLWLPVIFRSPFERFDMVIVDEAQDLSPLQHDMLDLMLKKPDGRLIAIGDPRQAIYGFRGALSNSMSQLAERFNCTELPLTVSFRCPRRVVTEARKVVSHITSAPNAPEGTVHYNATVADIKPGDVVICRYNKPIVRLAFKLIKRGIAARVLGRDFAKGLVKIVTEVGEVAEWPTFYTALEQYRHRQWTKFLTQGKEAKAESILDRCECIAVIGESAKVNSIAELKKAIELLFDDNGGQVTLSTIHKAKGMEWDRVFFLGAEKLPPRWVPPGSTFYEQEQNMIYVGVTRAKDTLFFIAEKEVA